jgi:hypothetical protein
MTETKTFSYWLAWYKGKNENILKLQQWNKLHGVEAYSYKQFKERIKPLLVIDHVEVQEALHAACKAYNGYI